MPKNEDSDAQPPLWGRAASRHAAADRPSGRPAVPMVKLPPQRPTSPMEFSELWNIDEVAKYLGVPKQTIYCWRTSAYGPQGFRVVKHVRWRAATVIAWTLELERRK